MRLTVIGCGYVGLVTGACLAAAGHEVFCTDVDKNRIDQLNAGKVPIYEEHLDEVLKRAVAEKKIFLHDRRRRSHSRRRSHFYLRGHAPQRQWRSRP